MVLNTYICYCMLCRILESDPAIVTEDTLTVTKFIIVI